MIACAQTNLQLFNQLRRCHDYSADDLALIRGAHDLAMRLFTGCFRPSGKPFLCHAVGTASLLGSLHLPSTVVAAGLLHAAYTHGEFGTEWRGISVAKRQQLQRVVGNRVEEIVARYTTLQWNRQTIRPVLEALDTLSEIERHVVLIHVANELEDYWDLGVLYCGDAEDRRGDVSSHLHLMVPMAEKLGYPELATALDQAFTATVSSELPTPFQTHETASFLVCPASHRPRVAVTLHRFFAGPFRAVCRRLFGWRRGLWIERMIEELLCRVVLNWRSAVALSPGRLST